MEMREKFLDTFEYLDAKNKAKMIEMIQILNEVEKIKSKAEKLGVNLEVKLHLPDYKENE